MAGKIRKFWILLAALFFAAAIALCALGAVKGIVFSRPEGDPQQTVIRFFDALDGGNFEAACGCLADCSSLGLGRRVEGDSALLWDALRQSYTYRLEGDCECSQLSAVQQVRFSSLDIGRAETLLGELVNACLEEYTEDLSLNEIYDEEGSYRREVTDHVYREALRRLLSDPQALSTEKSLQIPLSYVDGQWLIRTTDELLAALAGGKG